MRWRFKFTVTALLLIAPGVFAQDQRQPVPQARFLSSYSPGNDIAGFGGLSGFEISKDGQLFFALSDRSILFEGQLSREDGIISSLTLRPAMPLLSGNGQIFRGKSGDSEGLALSPTGDLTISFEGIPRLSRVPDTSSGPIHLDRIKRPEEFRRLPENAALEALAISKNGAFFTMPEDPRDGGGFPVWRFRNNIWDQPFMISRIGEYLPVGADFGPDGMFYLLERRLGLLGFASRIRRFRFSGDNISESGTILETTAGQHDNLEGIALWRDDQGRIRITMVSDNNYFILQTTEFVEYVIP